MVMVSIHTIMSTTLSCQPPIIKYLGSVTVWKRVNSQVKILSGEKPCVFPQIAKLLGFLLQVEEELHVCVLERAYPGPRGFDPKPSSMIAERCAVLGTAEKWR